MRALTSFEIDTVTGGASKTGCRYVNETKTTENSDGSKTTETKRTFECFHETT